MSVRAGADGVARIRDAIGQSNFHGISVQGHCMGIVARTWRLPSQAAGYAYATDGADAVIRAGKMRHGDPPPESVVWWAHRTPDRLPGHVATLTRPGIVTGNVGATIQDAALSRFSSLERLGWCWPSDVPGWGPAPTPPQTPDPVTDRKDDDMPFLFRTHADAEKDGQGIGQGAAYLVHSGHAVQMAPGFTYDPELIEVRSPSEACDQAFYASVTRHKL